ncbi:MAG TPA: LysM peptidoglycan-binding domain-containing protein [Longimicrobiales bacterium]|nr:LysM peptidoglycan-binding domain-containing protein [Longimicrobiales bacterium]
MVRSATALLAVLILSGFAAVQQVATHTVVDGDTLWDLAERYYSDPFDWRRIWEANRSDVADPNLIFPGQVLTIPGREATVTQVTVEAPPAREPAAPSRRTTAEEPTVFRQDTSYMRAGVVRSEELDYFAVPRDLVYSAPWIVGFDVDPPHAGVIESLASNVNISQTPRGYDRVRLSYQGEVPRVGTQLQIFRVSNSIDAVGQVVVPTGVVTVSEVDDQGVVGIITKEYERVSLGDLVGPLPTYALSLGQKAEEVATGPEAMIMGFAGRAVLQDIGAVAFLDQGTTDGVAVGDEFVLYNARAGADEAEGRLQVVGVKSNTASARIVSMDDVVFRQGVVVRLARKMR